MRYRLVKAFLGEQQAKGSIMSGTAAELIAKVKVNGYSEFKSTMDKAGQSVHDTAKLVQQYGQMMKHSASSMGNFTSEAANVGNALTSLASTGFNPLLMALEAVAAATIGAAAGFFAFTKAAVSEAMSIQRLTATYSALSGGIEAAGQKMKFLQTYSRTSINQFDTLAEAGTILEASGLRVERFVKGIDQMSGLFGGGKQNVMELTDAIARMASGSMGEAERVFRKFGVTTADFAREGLKVDSGGQITGTIEQKLAAWERIAKRKAGSLGDAIKDGLTLKFSNLEDAWKKLLDGFGQGWFPMIGRIVDSVTQFANFLNDGNFFAGLGKQFAGVFDNLLGTGGDGSGIQKFLAYLAAGVERLPDLFSAVGSAVKSFMEMLRDGIVWTYNAIGHDAVDLMKFMNDTLRHGLNNMRSIAASVVDEAHKFGMFGDVDADALRKPLSSKDLGQNGLSFTPVKNFSDLMGRGIDGIMNGIGSPFGALGGDLNKRADDIFKQYQEYQKKPQAGVDGSGYPMFGENYVAQIAQNTAKTATETAKMASLKAFALGGGDLGQMGVTAAEMYGHKGKKANSTINVNGNEGMFRSWVQSVIADALVQQERSRGLTINSY